MEITIKIDKRSKQAKAVLEMLKTFDFVKFVSSEEQEISSVKKKISKEQFVEEISKKVNKGAAEKWCEESIKEISKEINRAGTKKAFAELGLDYDSYSRW